MSYSITVPKLRRPVRSIRDLREEDSIALGDLEQVKSALEAWAPGIGWQHSTSGRVKNAVSWWASFIDTATRLRRTSASTSRSGPMRGPLLWPRALLDGVTLRLRDGHRVSGGLSAGL